MNSFFARLKNNYFNSYIGDQQNIPSPIKNLLMHADAALEDSYFYCVERDIIFIWPSKGNHDFLSARLSSMMGFPKEIPPLGKLYSSRGPGAPFHALLCWSQPQLPYNDILAMMYLAKKVQERNARVRELLWLADKRALSAAEIQRRKELESCLAQWTGISAFPQPSWPPR